MSGVGYISGYSKIDIATVNASSGFTTPYYDMGLYEKAIFILNAGSMNASGTITLTGYQAVSSTGSGAQVTGAYTTMGSTTALACDIDKAVAVVLSAVSTSVANGATVIINGVTFTANSTTTTGDFGSGRLWYSSSDGGVSTQALEHLAAFINHATYGCTGLLAQTSATYIYIEGNPPGGKVITTQLGTSTGCLFRSIKNSAILEIRAEQLTSASSMRYVAVTGTLGGGETVRSHCVVIRTGARYSPDSTALVGAYAQGV